jgi:hypothetical protein
MVRLTHGNLKAGSVMVGNASRGWPRVLSSLKCFLETGTGLNVYDGRAPTSATPARAGTAA